MISPCKDCPFRRQGCHSECNRYKLYAVLTRYQNRKQEEWRRSRSRIFTPALLRRTDDCQRRGNKFWGMKTK